MSFCMLGWAPACVAATLLLLIAGSAPADTFVLANGDKLNGEVVSWAVDHVVIDHPQLGRMRLALDQLDIDTGKPPTPGLFGTDFLRGWKRSVDFGMSGKQGNSETSNLTTGFEFSFEDEFARWMWNGRYYFNRDEDGVSDNNARVDLRRDWLMPDSPWFAFASFRYQFDEFESWLHRTVLTVGPGYELLRREGHSLDARVGGTFTREFGDRDRNKAESLFALDYSWKVSDRTTLTLSNLFFLQLQPGLGQFRNQTLADVKVGLLKEPALNLRLGAENEYETDTEPGDLANDLKYYVSLGVDF